METINIKIPVGLSPEKEFDLIFQVLGRKYLPVSSDKLKGGGYTIRSLQTKIVITREITDKPIVLFECYCGTQYEKSVAKVLYVNYGGRKKKKNYCSDECRQAVIDIAGDRCSIKPGELKSAIYREV